MVQMTEIEELQELKADLEKKISSSSDYYEAAKLEIYLSMVNGFFGTYNQYQICRIVRSAIYKNSLAE